MPCMSYDTNWAHDSNDRDVKRLKTEADKLARIACAALTALEEMGKEDFLLLKNDEVADWWAAHKEADRKEQARVAEQQRREAIKQEALNKLSDEEKELLGLKPKTIKSKQHMKHQAPTLLPARYEIDSYVEDLTDEFESIVKRINGGDL